jgi:hypothetical protein
MRWLTVLLVLTLAPGCSVVRGYLGADSSGSKAKPAEPRVGIEFHVEEEFHENGTLKSRTTELHGPEDQIEPMDIKMDRHGIGVYGGYSNPAAVSGNASAWWSMYRIYHLATLIQILLAGIAFFTPFIPQRFTLAFAVSGAVTFAVGTWLPQIPWWLGLLGTCFVVWAAIEYKIGERQPTPAEVRQRAKKREEK